MGFPGGLVRLVPGDDPVHTALAEFFEVPWFDPDVPEQGYSPRGMDVDSNGVVWTVLIQRPPGELRPHPVRRSAQRAGGDRPALRRRLDALPVPGAQLRGPPRTMRAPIPRTTTSPTASICSVSARTCRSPPATCPRRCSPWWNGEFLTFRVPYPLGSFYAKGLDGRIDDPTTGWKGRAVWTTSGSRAPFHAEDGKEAVAPVFKFQVRPDPLAK